MRGHWIPVCLCTSHVRGTVVGFTEIQDGCHGAFPGGKPTVDDIINDQQQGRFSPLCNNLSDSGLKYECIHYGQMSRGGQTTEQLALKSGH